MWLGQLLAGEAEDGQGWQCKECGEEVDDAHGFIELFVRQVDSQDAPYGGQEQKPCKPYLAINRPFLAT